MKLKHIFGLFALVVSASVALQSTACPKNIDDVRDQNLCVFAGGYDFEATVHVFTPLGVDDMAVCCEIFALADFGPAVPATVTATTDFVPVYDQHLGGSFRPPDLFAGSIACLPNDRIRLARLHGY